MQGMQSYLCKHEPAAFLFPFLLPFVSQFSVGSLSTLSGNLAPTRQALGLVFVKVVGVLGATALAAAVRGRLLLYLVAEHEDSRLGRRALEVTQKFRPN